MPSVSEYLRLTDGTVEIDLMVAGSTGVLTYAPRSPDVSIEEIEQAAREGSEITLVSRRNVTESAEIRLHLTTYDLLRNKIQDIQAMLRRAEEKAWKVYVHYRAPGVTGSVFRSEIFTGNVEVEEDSFDVGGWEKNNVVITITWTRRYYWESLTEEYLTLSNGSGSSSAGLTVTNFNASLQNRHYAHIAAASIAGVIPAPCRIEMTSNGPNDTSRHSEFWLGHNVFQDPANFDGGISESEGLFSGGVDNGTYRSFAVAANSGELVAFTITFPSTILNQTRGAYVLTLARLVGISTGLKVRYRQMIELTELWRSPWIRIPHSEEFQEFGPLKLPVFEVPDPAETVYPITVQIIVQNPTASSITLALSDLILIPLTGYRKLESLGYDLAYGARLVLDEMDDEVYSDGWSTVGRFRQYVPHGKPILLWPNKDQRLFFATVSSTGGSASTRSVSMRIAYRQRKLTV